MCVYAQEVAVGFMSHYMQKWGKHTLCNWEEGRRHVPYIKRHAALEFAKLLRVHRNRCDNKHDCMWGDEIEFMLIKDDKLLLEAHIDFLPHTSGRSGHTILITATTWSRACPSIHTCSIRSTHARMHACHIQHAAVL